MVSYDDIARSWAEFQTGKREKFHRTHGNVFADSDALYSYGKHFPLAIPLRAADGKLRAFLLNGDNYSVTTSRHQSITRTAVARTGVENVVIPFTAISRAGIVRDSIRIVESRDAWYTSTEHVCDAPHEYRGNGYVRDDDARDDSHYGATSSAYYPYGAAAYPHSVRYVSPRTWDAEANVSRAVSCPGKRVHVTFQHHLGASVFLATVRTHHGGQSLTRENVRFLSAFDDQERAQLYFLAELPANSYAETYAEAIRDLRPFEVRRADGMGIAVTRQGDMFAVPRPEITTRALRDLGATFTKRTGLLGTIHTATEVATLADGTTYGRGVFRHEPQLANSWRERDHANRTIGDRKQWHLIVPNTVPRAGASSAFEPSEPRAWTIGGRVD